MESFGDPIEGAETFSFYEKKVGIDMNGFLELIIGFVRPGVLGYGGGPSVIPLIRYEAVQKYHWMTDEEFGDILAMANALPGPIATKMAAYIGFKVKGSAGAVTAILAHILPSVIGMIALLGFLYSLRESPIVSGMIQAVSPVIGVMLAVLAYEFIQKARKGVGWGIALTILVLSGLAIEGLGIHPGIIIAVCLVSAFVVSTWKERRKNNNELG